jgi:hypothetical protein
VRINTIGLARQAGIGTLQGTPLRNPILLLTKYVFEFTLKKKSNVALLTD